MIVPWDKIRGPSLSNFSSSSFAFELSFIEISLWMMLSSDAASAVVVVGGAAALSASPSP